MKSRKRFWSCGVLLLVLLLAAAFVLRRLAGAFAPDVYGIEPGQFADSAHGAVAVSKVIHSREVPASLPNVVVILADDLGYGDIGAYGGSVINTPNLDALAAEGARFTTFYASAPVCSPSRAGLLTGRYPLRSGIITALQAADDDFMRTATYQAGVVMSQLGMVDLPGGENMVHGLPPGEITLPEALHEQGYRTMAVGKWHLGDFTGWPEYHPSNHGFDHFVGFNHSNDDFPVAFWRDQDQVVENIGLDQARYTRLFTEEAVHFIESAEKHPFFLYLAHKDPHLPFFPSEPFAGTSEAGPYGDAVAELDWSVGEIVTALRSRGLADNTLLVFTSDNGPWFEGSAGPLRGRKGQSYEGGYRVPCIAWWPGRIPAATVIDAPAMNIDLFPTVLALAGLGLPEDRVIDGVNLMPLLNGETMPDRPLFFSHDYDVEALRLGPWKLYRSNSHYVWPLPLDKKDNIGGRLAGGRDYRPPGASESIPTLGTWPMLHHLERDPGESYNLAKRHPEIVEAMTQQLEAWRTSLYANPRGWLEGKESD